MIDVPFHSPDHPGNRDFVAFAQRELGTQVQIDNFSRNSGRSSVVWRLTGSDGSRVWLKHHENSKLYRRELIGLECFVPALGPQTWWASPILLAKDDEIEVMLMTGIEGEVLDRAVVSADDEATMFYLAGRFSSQLHNLELPVPDGVTASEHLRNQLESYLAAGMESIDLVTADWAQALIEQACSTGEFRRVPCHRDFAPRNWLILRDEIDIRFGVIDWERADWDQGLMDAQRMVFDHWNSGAHLREAYYKGYGREPTAAESMQLDAICLVNAIASIPWAIEHGDERFVNLSRQVIERIRAKLGS